MKISCKWLVLIVVLALQMSPAVMAEMDLKQIQALVTDGKLDQALTETDAILTKGANNIQALFLKGLILTKLNKLSEAEAVFLQLINNNPELPEPYNNLAVIYASQGQYEKAKEALTKAINTHPSYATAHENLGDIYAKMASQAYNQALELDSSNDAAREKLSLINELFSAPVSKTKIEETPTAVAAVTPPPVSEEKTEEKAPETVAVAPPAPTPPSPPPVQEQPPAPEIQPVPEVPPAPDENQIKQAIIDNVNNWAGAWSRKDVDAYLSFYAPDYTPSRDMSRKAWVAQRKLRLSEPAFIKIGVSNINIVMHGDEHVQATFLQNYQSDTFSDSVTKTLLFRNLNGQWLIVQEKNE